MKKLATVTIALCAYNEAANIEGFLRSVIRQREDGFKISSILIVDDGSTDTTVEEILKVSDPRIKVISSKKRIGKSSHLNEIYEGLTDDYLVQTDADVIFSHEYIVRDMIQPLMQDPKVGMCGGNPLPCRSTTFIEESVNYTVSVYARLRSLVRGGNNVFSVDGRLLSYRKELVKEIFVPINMIANDMFTFFCCKTLGYQYRFVESAIVNFQSPKTVRDQIRQNTRFRAAPIRMKKYFDEELVRNETKIENRLLLSLYLVTFIKHPVHCSVIYAVNLYTKILAKMKEDSLTAKWDMAVTTKKLKYV